MIPTILRRALAALALAALPALVHAQQLTIAAAASLTESFQEIGRRFEAAHPGATLRFDFGASGVLLQQITQGAPVDVFASADAETVDRGVRARLLDASTRRDFAANTLVLVVPASGPAVVARLEDLAAPAVRRVAIGKPATVPVGRYTRQALEAAGLWAMVEPKAVHADSVRQVLEYVSRGEVDAGFVYRTDAEVAKGSVRTVAAPGGHTPMVYPAIVVSGSRQPALARAFVSFLATPDAQAVLARAGFASP